MEQVAKVEERVVAGPPSTVAERDARALKWYVDETGALSDRHLSFAEVILLFSGADECAGRA